MLSMVIDRSMEKLNLINQKVLDRTALLGVIGLGYVGLPVACMFAQEGYSVIGLDIKQERIDRINQGESPIEGNEPGLSALLAEMVQTSHLKATTNYQQLGQADIVLIDVETPVDENNQPRYAALRAACRSLAQVMKDGVLVIVESTIAPGTIDGLVRPLLEEVSGKKCDQDFYLGACPERVMPGKLLANLRKMSRVCGGSTPAVADVMVSLYRCIVKADLDTADPVTAELTKTAENSYRDVNIAFANELALICDVAGSDFMRVRELVNKSPGRHVLLAGAGVGGHCIPKDTWLLAYGAGGKVPLHLIPAARVVNDGMPIYMADLIAGALAEAGKAVNGARVVVLGLAYLEDSDDTRNSPSDVLINRLKAMGAEVIVHDPWVQGYQGDILNCVRGCDAAVIMVAHRAYRTLTLTELKEALHLPVLIDGRRLFEAADARAHGFIFRGLGQGQA
jgi:UDP-N-acetyl-D-mannosaminuronic acid dehydrogenase